MAAVRMRRAIAALRGAWSAAPDAYEPAWRLARALACSAMLAEDAAEGGRLAVQVLP